MAQKKPVKKAAKALQPPVQQAIPEGFTIPAGAQVPNWDYEKNRVLQGDVVAVKVIKKKKPRKGEKPTTRLMTIRDESGNLFQLWESAMLTPLFDEVKTGAEVYLIYDGIGEAQKGKNPPKMFRTGYQNPGKTSRK